MTYYPSTPLSRPLAGTWLSSTILKSRLGIPASETAFDTEFTGLIEAVQGVFEGPEGLGRPIFRTSYKEVGTIRETLWAPTNWPVVRTVSVYDPEDIYQFTPTSCEISGQRQNLVILTGMGSSTSRTGFEKSGEFLFRYESGFVSAGDIETWSAGATLAAGDIVRPTDGTERYVFRVTVAGDTDVTEPDWSDAVNVGDEITDGTVTYIATLDYELPRDIVEAGYATAIDWFRGSLQIPIGVVSETTPGGSTIYKSFSGSIPQIASNLLLNWK